MQNCCCNFSWVGCLWLSLFFFISTAFSNCSCQLLDSSQARNACGSGLYCGTCPAAGKNRPICLRDSSITPTSIINGLPFNKYSWIVTHNSFSIVDAPPLLGQRITFYNQEDSVTNQLKNGVRGLMLDMYDFQNDIWLCHSIHGQCFNITAFQPAVKTLMEVETFLTENPSEIVTIMIEDYVHTPNGLTNLFTKAKLMKYWFPVTNMTTTDNWPTVNDMVQQNHRLLVFTSNSSKEAQEGISYQWKYFVENIPGDPGVQGSCKNRKESYGLDSNRASLFLQNYFHTIPIIEDACKENSAPLAAMVETCFKAAGNKMPNFLAVNFYLRSDGGGVFDSVDRMNGRTLCGCSTVTACQVGSTFGSCKNTNRTQTIKGVGSSCVSVSEADTGKGCARALFLLFLFVIFNL